MTEYTALVTDFRPLSRGSFFNVNVVCWDNVAHAVFVPFLGDFFSIISNKKRGNIMRVMVVFVPFLGDFFSMTTVVVAIDECFPSFRPLSRGLFFNKWIHGQRRTFYRFRPLSRGLFFNGARGVSCVYRRKWFSSPFSGTFFQLL